MAGLSRISRSRCGLLGSLALGAAGTSLVAASYLPHARGLLARQSLQTACSLSQPEGSSLFILGSAQLVAHNGSPSARSVPGAVKRPSLSEGSSWATPGSPSRRYTRVIEGRITPVRVPSSPGRLLEDLEHALALEMRGGERVVGIADDGAIGFDRLADVEGAPIRRTRAVQAHIDRRLAELEAAGFDVPRRMEIILPGDDRLSGSAVRPLTLDTEQRRRLWEPMERSSAEGCRRGLARRRGPCGPYALSLDAALDHGSRGASPVHVSAELAHVRNALEQEGLSESQRQALLATAKEIEKGGWYRDAIARGAGLDGRYWRAARSIADFERLLKAQGWRPGSKGILSMNLDGRGHAVNVVVDAAGQVRLFDQGGRQELRLIERRLRQLHLVGDRPMEQIPEDLRTAQGLAPHRPSDWRVNNLRLFQSRHVDGSVPAEQSIDGTAANLRLLKSQPSLLNLQGFSKRETASIRQLAAEYLRPDQLELLGQRGLAATIASDSSGLNELRAAIHAQGVSRMAHRDRAGIRLREDVDAHLYWLQAAVESIGALYRTPGAPPL